jgi:hypothetical protein
MWWRQSANFGCHKWSLFPTIQSTKHNSPPIVSWKLWIFVWRNKRSRQYFAHCFSLTVVLSPSESCLQAWSGVAPGTDVTDTCWFLFSYHWLAIYVNFPYTADSLVNILNALPKKREYQKATRRATQLWKLWIYKTVTAATWFSS